MNIEELKKIADDRELMEVGRKAVEDVLLDFRESRISQFRGSGLVIREKDGKDSSVIRLGTEDALAIGLRAIAEHLEKRCLITTFGLTVYLQFYFSCHLWLYFTGHT